MDKTQLLKLIKDELGKIDNSDRRESLSNILIDPYLEDREWDYSETKQTFPCWIVASPNESILFAFCEKGFGPDCPWGLLSSASQGSMGPDSCWYSYLDDLYIQSGCWSGELPDNYVVRGPGE